MKHGENVCGYDSCPCVGVNFISTYQGRVNYCVNGKRLLVDARVSMVLTPSATLDQVARLERYLLECRSKYVEYHTRNYPGAPLQPAPFDLPLSLYTK